MITWCVRTAMLVSFVALTTVETRAQKIYWNGSGVDGIVRANVDGSHRQAIAPGEWRQVRGIALDLGNGKMYLVDEDSSAPMIRRANLDGSGLEDLLVMPGGTGLRPHDISVDAAGGKFYWTDIGIDGIHRADLDGSNAEVLLAGPDEVDSPFGLALDLAQGKMYWGQLSSIRRANLDGSSVEDILVGVDVVGLTIDADAGKLYWLTGNNPDNMILRANLDGSTVEVVVSSGLAFSCESFALDPLAGKIYITSNNARTIQQVNLDGTGLEVFLQSNAIQPVGIDIDPISGTIYWSDSRAHGILRASPDGTGPEQVVQLPFDPAARAFAIDALSGKLYWTAWNWLPLAGDVRRSDLDGRNTEILVRGPPAYEIDDPRFEPWSIALDTSAGRMYWLDLDTEKIQSANLDGTDVRDVVQTSPSEAEDDYFHPLGMALDTAAGHLYWGEHRLSADGSGRIRRANFDGTGPATIVSGLQEPSAIAVDPGAAKIYWADSDLYLIQRANTDGTGIETVVPFAALNFYDFALDLTAGKMYWGDRFARRILRANLDGGPQEVVTTFESPRGSTSAIAVARVPGFAAESGSGRYLPLAMPYSAEPFALRVTSPDFACVQNYVQGDGRLGDVPLFRTSLAWGTVSVRGGEVVPSASYEIELEFADGTRSVPAVAQTARWGDTAGPFVGGRWTDPDGQVAISDAVACLDAFRHASSAPPLWRCDLEPQTPDGSVRMSDLVRILDAFRHVPYPYSIPCP